MDRENSPFDKVMADIKAMWGARCIPVVIPVPGNSAVMDVLGCVNPPDSVSELVKDCKNSLVEMAAENGAIEGPKGKLDAAGLKKLMAERGRVLAVAIAAGGNLGPNVAPTFHQS